MSSHVVPLSYMDSILLEECFISPVLGIDGFSTSWSEKAESTVYVNEIL